MKNPFRYFNGAPEIFRLTVMMHIHCSLSLRQVVDLLFERGIDICHETVRSWWPRFGPNVAFGSESDVGRGSWNFRFQGRSGRN